MPMPTDNIIPNRPAHPLPVEALAPDVTMTTIEIAARTGKKHHNVMRDVRKIEKALPGDQIKSDEIYHDDLGRPMPCYRIGRRVIMILTSGYSISLRAAVIDRLNELERAAAQPVIPTTYADALRLAADNHERAEHHRTLAEERQKLLEAQEPLVAIATRMLASPETMTITEAEKLVKLAHTEAFPILAEANIIFRRPSRSGKSRWQGTANALRRGYVEHEAYPVPTAGGPVEVYQVKLTGKGVAKLISLLINVQLDFGLDDDGAVDAA